MHSPETLKVLNRIAAEQKAKLNATAVERDPFAGGYFPTKQAKATVIKRNPFGLSLEEWEAFVRMLRFAAAIIAFSVLIVAVAVYA